MTSDIEFIKLDVQGRLQSIEASLLLSDPQLPVHLGAIHGALIQYEELVHMLTDAEIKTLVAGQIKHGGTALVDEVIKVSKTTAAKRIPKASADDF